MQVKNHMKKEKYLFTVDAVVTPPSGSSYGPGLCPGVKPEDKSFLWVGAPVILVLPNGQEIGASVKAFPMIQPKGYIGPKPVELSQNITSEVILVGTEVWLAKH